MQSRKLLTVVFTLLALVVLLALVQLAAAGNAPDRLVVPIGSLAEDTASYCPADDPDVGYLKTHLLGTGQGNTKKVYKTRRVVIPDHRDVVKLYGQLAAVDVGEMRWVRFRYPYNSHVQLNAPTSAAYQAWAVTWWGSDLDPARFMKGQFFWSAGAAKSPRAFVLWPTYRTTDEYANVFKVFSHSNKNHVYHGDGWYAEQTHRIAIPATQMDGADIRIQVALVDNDKDMRPVILTATAGGVSRELVLYGPNSKDLLNLEFLVLPKVPKGTDFVELHLVSPPPSAEYPEGGDSVAMIGAAVHYKCAPEVNGD